MQRYIYHNEENLASPCVLFQDYNGFWAPLDSLFFSTSSKVLVSRHPESSIEEVVSHYCPQCLNKYSEDDVAKYRSRCSSCLECPSCNSILTGQIMKQTGDSDQCCLSCSMCSWSSSSCGVVGDSEDVLSSIVIQKENDSIATEVFATILSSLNASSTPNAPQDYSAKNLRRHDTWDMKALDQLQVKKDLESRVYNSQEESSLHNYLQEHGVIQKESEYRSKHLTDIRSCADASALSTVNQRLKGEYIGSSNTGSVTSQLLPQRRYLRTKKMLRCRRDVKQGKMSILIQPKTFPLEGDSSHKLHQGKWFLKDSSACHHLPRVLITKLPNFTSEDASGNLTGFLHVEVINSKDSSVAVLLKSVTQGVKDVALKLEDISLDCNDQLSKNKDTHPPFAFTPTSHVLQMPDAPSSCLVLQAYEDELLRDSELPEVSDFADEDSNKSSWNVLMDAHVAKICIPVSCSAIDADINILNHAEAVFAMTVADVKEASDELAEGLTKELMQPSLKDSVTVSFRVAFKI
mmetsp:Transcript_23428/g.39740  ORF Transcript_23428/g.39740 Transcript_23428/m.39740 type:complete len:519 (-) Transcript_23428:2710-4266(-)